MGQFGDDEDAAVVVVEARRWFVWAILWEGIGAVFYTTVFPERWFRGQYWIDTGMSSHILWHMCNIGFDYGMFQVLRCLCTKSV